MCMGSGRVSFWRFCILPLCVPVRLSDTMAPFHRVLPPFWETLFSAPSEPSFWQKPPTEPFTIDRFPPEALDYLKGKTGGKYEKNFADCNVGCRAFADGGRPGDVHGRTFRVALVRLLPGGARLFERLP